MDVPHNCVVVRNVDEDFHSYVDCVDEDAIDNLQIVVLNNGVDQEWTCTLSPSKRRTEEPRIIIT